MAATILVGMLCAHLLCFSVMFLLIGKRLQGKKMGMDLFAIGNLLLGLAYALQLVEKGPTWSLVSVVNHSLTLAAPIFAKDLYGEIVFFALLISGICVLNALKFWKLLDGGLDALQMDREFQLVFYAYMSSLATVLSPSIVWLVLRRLTDELRDVAARDPMTQLLNRRGLTETLQRHFNSRKAVSAYLLILDIDHFKHVNDTYGHPTGDALLCQVAKVLRATVRSGDLASRIGGEEFASIRGNTGF